MYTHHIQMCQLQRIPRCRQHRLRSQTDIFMLGHPLKIISINANTSSSVTEDFLQHAVENKTDLILVQEPWYYGRGIDPPRTEWGNFVSTTHSSLNQITPAITDPEHLHMSPKHANSVLTSPRDRQPIPTYKSLTLQTGITPFKSSIYTTRRTKQEATRTPSKDTSKNTSCPQTPS